MLKRVLPGETLRPEPRSDDESDSDADEHGNLRDFVVYDKIVSTKPPGHDSIDKAWSAWKPKTKGSLRFKKMVDKYSK